jgi:hypothetical protein
MRARLIPVFSATLLLALAMPCLDATAETISILPGQVQISEVFLGFTEDGPLYQYVVKNPHHNPPLMAVAVRNDTMALEPGPWAERPAWTATSLSPEDWDGPTPDLDGFAFGMGDRFRTDQFGNFQDLFGMVDPEPIFPAQVGLYIDDDELNNIMPGQTESRHFFYAFMPMSFTLVIFANGQAQSGQVTPLVPLPSAVWLGLGLMAIFGVHRLRRRRSAS